MKNIIKILMFIICFLHTNVYAQNLVPNNSFETYIDCYCQGDAFTCLDSTWFEFNSADYLNVCDTSTYRSIPVNRYGFQYAFDGNAYMGIISFSTSFFTREYIEIKLSEPLIAGQIYYVQFHVSLADTFQYAIENIGALFTDTLFDPYPPPSYSWQTGIPQVENSLGNMLNDKTNWTPISGSFVANGGEQYMAIGNFRNDAQTITQYLGGGDSTAIGAYYYIDDVYVGSTPPVSVPENEKSKFNYKLYPNPNNGNMIVEYSLAENETGFLNLYSITGNLIHSYPLQQASHKLLIENEELKSGIYLYDVIINDKKVKTDKVVIIK